MDTDIPGFRIPMKPKTTEGEAVSRDNYQTWLEDWIKYHPDRTLSEREEKAFRLWYALVHASKYGYIDVNEDDDPTDAPDFISVIVRFLDGFFTEKSSGIPADFRAFLALTDISYARDIKQWLEHDIKKSLEEVSAFEVNVDVLEIPGDGPWKQHKAGDFLHFMLTFTDGQHAYKTFRKEAQADT
jgi:hypothetical protein